MNRRSIYKDSFMLTLGKSSRTILMMFYAMFASRFFAAADYGTYKQMVLINTMLVAIVPLGIPTSVSYYYQNLDEKGRSRLVSNTATVSLCLSALCAAGLFFCRPLVVSLFNNPDIGGHYLALMLYVFITVLFSFMENLYISTRNAMLLGKINMVFAISFFAGILAATWLTGDLSVVFFWMFLCELVKSLIMAVILQRKYRYSFGIDPAFLKEQFIYCIPLGLVSIVQFVNNYLDKLSISNRFDAEQYAVYINGASEVPIIGLITVSIATVALPMLSKMYNTDHDVGGMIDSWKSTQKTAATILYPIFWALLLCSPGVVEFLYSEKYLASVPFFIIFLLKQPLAVTVYGNILIVLKKSQYTLYNFIITIALNLTLNILLIRVFGMIGAAVSSVFCQMFMTVLQLVQISKFTGHKKRDLMPFKDLAKLLVSAGAVALVFFVLMRFFDFGNLINLFVYAPLTALCGFAVYYKLGYIAREDVRAVVNKFLRKKNA